MIRDTIQVVADSPFAGAFVIVCALIGLSEVCGMVVGCARALRAPIYKEKA